MAQREYADVTPLFAEATKAMPLGKMLHGADFNMWDAMHAIELFDPKMDPSLLASSEASFVTLDSLLRADAADAKAAVAAGASIPPPPSPRAHSTARVPLVLTAPDVIALLDELLATHVSFLDGYTLSSNVFTCVYLHRRDLLERHARFVPRLSLCALSPSSSIASADGTASSSDTSVSVAEADAEQWHLTMRDACVRGVRAWVRACGLVRALVMRADLYEEDDFVTALPNRIVASTFELGDGPELAGAASTTEASGSACSAAAPPAPTAPHPSYSSLCHELSVDHMCADIDTSIATLAALASTAPTAVAALAASFDGGSTSAAAASDGAADAASRAASAHALLDALVLRLRLVQSYLSALAALHPMAAIGTADAQRNGSAEAIGAAWSARDVRDAAQRLRQTVEAIAQAAGTLQLRVPTNGRGAPNESGPRSVSSSSSSSDSTAAAGAGKFVEPPSAAAVAAAALASSAQIARTVGALRPPGSAADVERAMNASAPPRYVRRYGRRDAMCLLAGTCERLQRVCGIVDVASVELAPFARSTPATSASGSAGGNSSGSVAPSSSSSSTSVCRVDDVCVFVRALAAWTPVAAPIEQLRIQVDSDAARKLAAPFESAVSFLSASSPSASAASASASASVPDFAAYHAHTLCIVARSTLYSLVTHQHSVAFLFGGGSLAHSVRALLPAFGLPRAATDALHAKYVVAKEAAAAASAAAAIAHMTLDADEDGGEDDAVDEAGDGAGKQPESKSRKKRNQKKKKAAQAKAAGSVSSTSNTAGAADEPTSFEYEYIDWMSARVAQTCAQLFKTLCLAPHRQATAIEALLDEFGVIQSEAQFVDQQCVALLSAHLDLDLPVFNLTLSAASAQSSSTASTSASASSKNKKSTSSSSASSSSSSAHADSVAAAPLIGDAPPADTVVYHHPHFSVAFELTALALQQYVAAAFQIAAFAPSEWLVSWCYFEFLCEVRESSRRLATRPKSWALRSARRLLPLPISSRPSSSKHKASAAAQTQPAAVAVAMTDALAELRHMTVIGAANGGANATSAGLVSVFAGRSLTSIDMIINEMNVAMSRGSYRTAQVLALRGWFPAIEIVRPTAEADAAAKASSSSSASEVSASSASPPSSSSSSSASDSLQSAAVRFAHRFAAFHRLVQPQPLQISQLLVVLDRHRKHARTALEAEHALKYQAQLQQQRMSAKQSPASSSSPPLSESMPPAELEPLVNAGEVRAAVAEALTEFKRIKPLADRVQALASVPFSLPAPPAWVAHAKALQRIAVTNSVLLMRLAQLESEAAEAAEQQANGEAAAGSTVPWRWRAHCDWSLSATFPVFHVTKQKTGAAINASAAGAV